MMNFEKEKTTFSNFGYEFYLSKNYLDFLDKEDAAGWEMAITRTIFQIIALAYKNSVDRDKINEFVFLFSLGLQKEKSDKNSACMFIKLLCHIDSFVNSFEKLFKLFDTDPSALNQQLDHIQGIKKISGSINRPVFSGKMYPCLVARDLMRDCI